MELGESYCCQIINHILFSQLRRQSFNALVILCIYITSYSQKSDNRAYGGSLKIFATCLLLFDQPLEKITHKSRVSPLESLKNLSLLLEHNYLSISKDCNTFVETFFYIIMFGLLYLYQDRLNVNWTKSRIRLVSLACNRYLFLCQIKDNHFSNVVCYS